MSTERLPLDAGFFNRASIQELEAVPGIGPALAERIVAYRSEEGPFTTLSELARIRGIGNHQVERFSQEYQIMGSPAITDQLDKQELDTIVEDPEEDASDMAMPASLVDEPEASEEQEIPDEEETIEPTSSDFVPAEAIEIPVYQNEISEEPAPEAEPTSPEPEELVTIGKEPTPEPKVDVEQPAEPPAEAESAVAPKSKSTFAHDALLVGLGGLLGLILALVAMSIWFGSLRPVGRPEFEALSTNLDTVQMNSEMSWDRVSALDERTAAVINMVNTARTELDDISATVGTLKSDIAETRTSLQTSIDELSAETSSSLQELQNQLGEANSALAEMEGTVEQTQLRIESYDAFFKALGELVQGVNE